MASRKRYVIGNWKMNPLTISEAKQVFDSIKKSLRGIKRTRVVICPPHLYLGYLSSSYRGSSIIFGSQDVSETEKHTGSFTGEVSGLMLKRSGVEYVIVGHSEKRAAGDTNLDVSIKTRSALRAGITPVLCVGEQTRDEGGDFFRFLEAEIKESLSGVSKKDVGKLLVAYEPIWAIGKSAKDSLTPHELHKMVLFVRKILTKKFGRKSGMAIPVLYGGSVETSNDDSLITHVDHKDVDGFLVGHASLISKDFVSIVRTVDRAKA